MIPLVRIIHFGEFEFTPDNLIIPHEDAIGTWGTLFKEWLGMAVYKMMGYV
ncbi:MAG: hypothetical protein NWS46_02660 [Cyclobacteriaceae bacterium]|nr:hypothetical protein [Cyclobacteriaceae bacterium]